jgi:hypothetical protein
VPVPARSELFSQTRCRLRISNCRPLRTQKSAHRRIGINTIVHPTGNATGLLKSSRLRLLQLYHACITLLCCLLSLIISMKVLADEKNSSALAPIPSVRQPARRKVSRWISFQLWFNTYRCVNTDTGDSPFTYRRFPAVNFLLSSCPSI